MTSTLAAWLEAVYDASVASEVRRLIGLPPRRTTLRVNTLRTTVAAVQEALERHLSLQFRVQPHAVLDDVLTVDSLHVDRPVSPSAHHAVVSAKTGQAVLRGADVYAPGVLGMSDRPVPGDTVAVYADPHDATLIGYKDSVLSDKLFLGNGVLRMSHHTVFSMPKAQRAGLAVSMTDSVLPSPSLNGVLPDRILLMNLPSLYVAHVLSPAPGMTVLDMTAGVGGKTTHLAARMHDQGRILAVDRGRNKVEALGGLAELHGIRCISPLVMDVNKLTLDRASEVLNIGAPLVGFDAVLLDPPCSGIGQRPGLLPPPVDTAALDQFGSYQAKLLRTAVGLMRPGAVLVYSTCTLDPRENEAVVATALSESPGLRLVDATPVPRRPGLEGHGLDADQVQLVRRFTPDASDLESDTIGFFIAKFVKASIIK